MNPVHSPDRTVCIAPMMGCTDRHARFFLRLMSNDVLLYTEMLTSAALIHGQADRLLAFDPCEKPVALQLGGSDPDELAICARLGVQKGYAEINLNVGCPSPRVKAGRFGACLMHEPLLVADCVAAMREAVKIPVTVKCRTGVDEKDSYEDLQQFIETVHAAGCEVFILHARKAWLQGLSPRENREIPPLCYETVYRIREDFPGLSIIINGGIKTADDVKKHLQKVDGVMIGREAYSNPWLLADIAREIFQHRADGFTRQAVIQNFLPYIKKQLASSVKLSTISRHISGLFHGQPGGRCFRRWLSEHAHRPDAGIEVIQQALETLSL